MRLKGICAGLLSLLTSMAFASEHEAQRWVSLVPKGSVERFYLRMAADKYDLVVTTAPVAQAFEQRETTLAAGEQLLVMEEQRAPAQQNAVLGEQFRLGAFVVLSRMARGESHWFDADTPQNYIAAVPAEETAVTSMATQDIFHSSSKWLSPLTQDVDIEFLKEQIAALSGEKAIMIDGQSYTIKERGSASNKALARRYLKSVYEQLGFTVSEQKYSTSGSNFVAERAGTEAGKYLLLTSHLDSVNNAGADDDLAGTISALAAAKTLENIPLRIGVRVVAFDQEESGLVGSKAYVKALNTAGTLNQVVGVLNLEMTGYDKNNDGAFHVIDCNENQSPALTKAVMDAVAREQLPLKKTTACTNRSDHASFWPYKVPAIVISQNFFGGDSNPCYHKACDKMDIMNFNYMQAITKAVASATQGLVVAQ